MCHLPMPHLPMPHESPTPIPDAPACSCERCQAMCQNPCWGTPNEIEAIIIAGYGDQLMLDYWTEEDGRDIRILCGASEGRKCKTADWLPRGTCAFYKDGKCRLHRKKLKPYEGRAAHHNYYADPDGRGKSRQIRLYIKDLWDTERGHALVEQWIERYMR